MGTVVSVNEDASLINEIVSDLIKRQKAPMAMGTTKIAQAETQARHAGWREAKLEDIAHLVNQCRLSLYKEVNTSEDGKMMKFIPGVSTHQARKWYEEFILAHWNGAGEGLTDEDWYSYVDRRFDDLIHDEAMDELVEQARRRSILAGLVEPTQEDIEWLREEFDTYKAVADPYQKALNKLGVQA